MCSFLSTSYRVFESIKSYPNGAADKDLSKDLPETNANDRVKVINALLQKVSFTCIVLTFIPCLIFSVFEFHVSLVKRFWFFWVLCLLMNKFCLKFRKNSRHSKWDLFISSNVTLPEDFLEFWIEFLTLKGRDFKTYDQPIWKEEKYLFSFLKNVWHIDFQLLY